MIKIIFDEAFPGIVMEMATEEIKEKLGPMFEVFRKFFED